VPAGVEVRIFSGKSLLESRVFATNDQARSWIEEERDDLIGRGWTESVVDAAKDLLIVTVGVDKRVPRECCLCARWFESHTEQFVASLRLADADELVPLGVVCDECAAAGIESVRDRIRANAAVTLQEDHDDEYAAHLQRLAEANIVLPTADEVRMMRKKDPIELSVWKPM